MKDTDVNISNRWEVRPLFEPTDTYNRELLLRRTTRQFAWGCVLLAAILLAISFGCLIASVGQPLFSALAIGTLIAGCWSARYLLTHH